MTPRALDHAGRVAWLRLARTPQVGPVTFAQLLARFADPAAALDALPRLARRGGRIDPLAIPQAEAVEQELDAVADLGARVIAAIEPDFPPLLRALDPPPPVVTVLGHANMLFDPACAVVGARSASAIGRRFANDVAAGVGKSGYRIVSGLARGVDAAAHEGALETGTIAVVAGGIDNVYPPENANLRARIAVDGVLVSEQPLGTAPVARDFPRRNRLISGLSLGVVVIEAAEKSGSLITARYAGEQGREVMAAPGSPLDPRAKGSNRLIREGAALIECPGDVVDVLKGARPVAAREPEAAYLAAPPDEEALAAAADDVRDRVLELLSPSPVSRDDIVRYADAPAAAVAAALMELELAGKAAQLPGGLVALA